MPNFGAREFKRWAAESALEMKAYEVLRELGADIVNDYAKEFADWYTVSKREHQQYKAACRQARERKEQAPPSPHHDPDGWLRWNAEQDYFRVNGGRPR